MELNKEDYEGCVKAIKTGTAYRREIEQTIGGVKSAIKCDWANPGGWMLIVPTADFESVRVRFKDLDDFKSKVYPSPEYRMTEAETVMAESGLQRLVGVRVRRQQVINGSFYNERAEFKGVRVDKETPEYQNGPWSTPWAETAILAQAIEWSFLGTSRFGDPEDESIEPYRTADVRRWLINNFTDEVVRELGEDRLSKLRRRTEDLLRKDQSLLLEVLCAERPLLGLYIK